MSLTLDIQRYPSGQTQVREYWSSVDTIHVCPLYPLVVAKVHPPAIMMTSSNGNIFRVTGPLSGESTGHGVDSHNEGQWGGALMFSLIYTWTNGWATNRDASDLRRHRAHYDVTVMMVTIDLIHKPNNATVLYPTMHHFVTEMCTFLLQNGALWDIWCIGAFVRWVLIIYPLCNEFLWCAHPSIYTGGTEDRK